MSIIGMIIAWAGWILLLIVFGAVQLQRHIDLLREDHHGESKSG